MQSKAANQPLTIETGQALANTGRWETRQELPVETEILIPDYLPAVFKIVKCLLEPVIMQNSVVDRRWQCSGYLRCTVYYQSDEAGTRLYRTEQKYAFEIMELAKEIKAGKTTAVEAMKAVLEQIEKNRRNVSLLYHNR